MELRGRYRKYPDLERRILNMLKDSRNGIGFRELFSKLEKPGSKSTVSSTLKLLHSQKKIGKNRDGKYVLTTSMLLLSNVTGLKKLLNNLDKLIPDLKSEQRAYIGIKLWTVIFQKEFHPIAMFMQDSPYFRISNGVSKFRREKAVQEFFESYKYPSMFEDEMYQVFFSFCAKFSSPVLDSVFQEIFDFDIRKSLPMDTGLSSLVKSFNKEIWVTRNLVTTFYGTVFCKILLEKSPNSCNKETLQLIRQKDMFQKIEVMK